MKILHTLAAVLLALSLASCAKPAGKMAGLEPGMTKQEVIAVLGDPNSVSYDNGTECLYFALSEWPMDIVPGRYIVVLVDGKVSSYGKEQPADDW